MGVKRRIKVFLDQKKCITCGTCGAIAADVFVFDESTGKYKVQDPYGKWLEVDEQTYHRIKMAEQSCPVQCIRVEEKSE